MPDAARSDCYRWLVRHGVPLRSPLARSPIGRTAASRAQDCAEQQAETGADGHGKADPAQHRSGRERQDPEAYHGAEIGQNERSKHAGLPQLVCIRQAAFEEQAVVGADRRDQEQSEQIEDRQPARERQQERCGDRSLRQQAAAPQRGCGEAIAG